MVSLNNEQVAAVKAEDGPALVLAGAGTGKTRVIVERMLWLIEERGVDPRRLLALTFTNKAAAEMRQRLMTALNLERLDAWMGTFHSFGLYMLRREIGRLGRAAHFTVFDDTDQLSLMKRLIKDLPPHCVRVSPREALHYIGELKQRVERPPDTPAGSAEETAYRHLWDRYHDALLRATAVDFDDLLGLPAQILEQHEEARCRYEQRYQYVMVDEYQDTNHAQYRIVRALAAAHGNIFVVGDEDQSIYSWRGADIRNILDFTRDFPSARTFRLERNYRSTQPILDLANAVVAYNKDRLGKRLWTAEKEGDQPRLFVADDAGQEAAWIANDIVASKVPPREVAILLRTNAQTRQLEEAFRMRGMAYIVVGGIKFYSRKEIKDILAYLRLIVNPNDDESLRRVINVPARGIGAATLQHFEEYAAARNSSLFQVLRDTASDTSISLRARENASAFVHLIDDLAAESKSAKTAKLVEELIEKTAYRDFVRQSDEKDFRSRLEIVDEFVVACRQFDQSGAGGLLAFLQDLALMTDVDTTDFNAPAVTLMTCHSAKGLEFDQVYLAGMEDGLLPMVSDFDDNHDLEEERRLCYVAMTRARKRLTLTAARSRMLYGRHHDGRELSRFIHEAGIKRFQMVSAGGEAKAVRPEGPAQVNAQSIKIGTYVRHATFGPGTVMYTSGSGNNLRARIRFKTGKIAMLLVSVAPLEILEGPKS